MRMRRPFRGRGRSHATAWIVCQEDQSAMKPLRRRAGCARDGVGAAQVHEMSNGSLEPRARTSEREAIPRLPRGSGLAVVGARSVDGVGVVMTVLLVDESPRGPVDHRLADRRCDQAFQPVRFGTSLDAQVRIGSVSAHRGHERIEEQPLILARCARGASDRRSRTPHVQGRRLARCGKLGSFRRTSTRIVSKSCSRGSAPFEPR